MRPVDGIIHKNEKNLYELKLYLDHQELNEICEGLHELLKKKMNINDPVDVEIFQLRDTLYRELHDMWSSTTTDHRAPIMRGFVKTDRVLTTTQKMIILKNRNDKIKMEAELEKERIKQIEKETGKPFVPPEVEVNSNPVETEKDNPDIVEIDPLPVEDVPIE